MVSEALNEKFSKDSLKQAVRQRGVKKQRGQKPGQKQG